MPIRKIKCPKCDHVWNLPTGTALSEGFKHCPACGYKKEDKVKFSKGEKQMFKSALANKSFEELSKWSRDDEIAETEGLYER